MAFLAPLAGLEVLGDAIVGGLAEVGLDGAIDGAAAVGASAVSLDAASAAAADTVVIGSALDAASAAAADTVVVDSALDAASEASVPVLSEAAPFGEGTAITADDASSGSIPFTGSEWSDILPAGVVPVAETGSELSDILPAGVVPLAESNGAGAGALTVAGAGAGIVAGAEAAKFVGNPGTAPPESVDAGAPAPEIQWGPRTNNFIIAGMSIRKPKWFCEGCEAWRGQNSGVPLMKWVPDSDPALKGGLFAAGDGLVARGAIDHETFEMNDPSEGCHFTPAACSFTLDGQRYNPQPIYERDLHGSRVNAEGKRHKHSQNTIPAVFGFDTRNITHADRRILNGMVVEQLPGQDSGRAMFRNDKAGFEAEGSMTGVRNTFGGGIKHGRFIVSLGGKDNGTAKSNWVVVNFSKLDDDLSAAISDLYDMLSYSPMEMLQLLQLLYPQKSGTDQA